MKLVAVNETHNTNAVFSWTGKISKTHERLLIIPKEKYDLIARKLCGSSSCECSWNKAYDEKGNTIKIQVN